MSPICRNIADDSVQRKDPSDWDPGPQMQAAFPWTVNVHRNL